MKVQMLFFSRYYHDIECQVSNVEYRMSSIECRVSNVEYRMSSIECRVLKSRVLNCLVTNCQNSKVENKKSQRCYIHSDVVF